ncbi:MAG TPA: DUF6371 domain-containing protein [Chitinophagaceae bacterium]
MANSYRFILEPSLKLELDKRRSRVKYCPCGKKNYDGKFVPYEKFDDRGYCFSCEKCFALANITCPECKKENSFNRYIDTENGNIFLADHVGICLSCNYHYPPKSFFIDQVKSPVSVSSIYRETGNRKRETEPKETPKETPKEQTSFFPEDIFHQSLRNTKSNNFSKFLHCKFGEDVAQKLISTYFIASSKHIFRNSAFPNYISEPGATIFWQVDVHHKLRSGKIMLYNADTGKRIKEPFAHITWTHKLIEINDFSLQQCFFGEHLITDNTKPIAITESEKAAIIASVYLPEFVWIAAGSKDGLTLNKCHILKGRDVSLFPDLGALELWKKKADEFSSITTFKISDLLQRKAKQSEKKAGLDIADFLLKFDYEGFFYAEFDRWITEHQEGGIFSYGELRLYVSPRNMQTSGVRFVGGIT